MPIPDPGLIDILPPPAPPPGPVALLALLLGLLFAAAVLIYLLRRHLSRMARCQRALSRLQHRSALGSSAGASREQGFYIAALLRFALGRHHLDPDHALPTRLASRQGDWQVFLSRLMRACYAPQPPSATTLTRLCIEAHDWIRQWH